MIVQQVSASKIATGQFCFTRRNLLSQNERLSRYYTPANDIKTIIGEPEKRNNALFYPISRHKPVLFSVRQIVLKVILQ